MNRLAGLVFGNKPAVKTAGCNSIPMILLFNPFRSPKTKLLCFNKQPMVLTMGRIIE